MSLELGKLQVKREREKERVTRDYKWSAVLQLVIVVSDKTPVVSDSITVVSTCRRGELHT